MRSIAGPTIRGVVQKTVAKEVKNAVKTAVSEALDLTVVEELQLQAATAAERAVNEEFDALDDEVEEDAEEIPTLYYGSVDEFVPEYLRGTYRRRIDLRDRRWAAKWWEFDEAVIRLEALWRAWEQLRPPPGNRNERLVA